MLNMGIAGYTVDKVFLTYDLFPEQLVRQVSI